MRVGILALQGDVREHEAAIGRLDATAVRVLVPADLSDLDALVLPGGESTAISLLVRSAGLEEPLVAWISEGRPTLGTCAGLVLLARSLSDGRPDQLVLGGLDVEVRRNGYGRQRHSFEATVEVPSLGAPMTGVFIRAPRITSVGDDVEVLGTLDGEPVACRSGAVIASSFHPELADDDRLHRLVLSMA